MLTKESSAWRSKSELGTNRAKARRSGARFSHLCYLPANLIFLPISHVCQPSSSHLAIMHLSCITSCLERGTHLFHHWNVSWDKQKAVMWDTKAINNSNQQQHCGVCRTMKISATRLPNPVSLPSHHLSRHAWNTKLSSHNANRTSWPCLAAKQACMPLSYVIMTGPHEDHWFAVFECMLGSRNMVTYTSVFSSSSSSHPVGSPPPDLLPLFWILCFPASRTWPGDGYVVIKLEVTGSAVISRLRPAASGTDDPLRNEYTM